MSSTMNMNMNMNSILAALTAIESQIAAVRNVISSETGPTTPKKSKIVAAPVVPDAPVKPKRLINPKIAAMNDERKIIYAELKTAWSLANPSFTELSPAELKKAIAEGHVAKPPTFPEAIKEHSRRLRENDPAAEARHLVYLEKRAKKDTGTGAPTVTVNDTETVASNASADSKTNKRGPKPGFKLSDEEKAKRLQTRKLNAATKKISGMPPLPSSPDDSDA